jgi:siroheme synthase-like protein
LVVAPDATAAVIALAQAGRVRWERRRFERSDVLGRFLVVSATNDPEVQREVFAASEAHATFVLAIDDVAHGSVYGAAVVRRPPFTIAISSSAQAPALTRLLREILEQILPEDEWVSAARRLRAQWKKTQTPMASRFEELLKAFRPGGRT